MKTKQIIQIITLLLLSAYLLYCVWHFATHKHRPTYLDCGKVVSKSSDEVAIKYGTKPELYLNVEFENSGFHSIECIPTTYFSKKIGDNVCFDFKEDVGHWYHTSNFIGFVAVVLLGLIALVCFIFYLIPNSWKIT